MSGFAAWILSFLFIALSCKQLGTVRRKLTTQGHSLLPPIYSGSIIFSVHMPDVEACHRTLLNNEASPGLKNVYDPPFKVFAAHLLVLWYIACCARLCASEVLNSLH